MIRPAMLLLAAVCLSLPGCQRPEDPAVLQQRQKYLLTEEPPGAVGVVEAHAKVTQPASSGQRLILVGRVGAGLNQTWDPGKAAFVVSDPSVKFSSHEHGPGHEDNFRFAGRRRRDAGTALIK